MTEHEITLEGLMELRARLSDEFEGHPALGSLLSQVDKLLPHDDTPSNTPIADRIRTWVEALPKLPPEHWANIILPTADEVAKMETTEIVEGTGDAHLAHGE